MGRNTWQRDWRQSNPATGSRRSGATNHSPAICETCCEHDDGVEQCLSHIKKKAGIRDFRHLMHHLALIPKPVRPILQASLSPLLTSDYQGFKCSLSECVSLRVTSFVLLSSIMSCERLDILISWLRIHPACFCHVVSCLHACFSAASLFAGCTLNVVAVSQTAVGSNKCCCKVRKFCVPRVASDDGPAEQHTLEFDHRDTHGSEHMSLTTETRLAKTKISLYHRDTCSINATNKHQESRGLERNRKGDCQGSLHIACMHLLARVLQDVFS